MSAKADNHLEVYDYPGRYDDYVRKSERIDRVVFKIRYRPSDDFDKDYTLSVTVNNEHQFDEPTIPGP